MRIHPNVQFPQVALTNLTWSWFTPPPMLIISLWEKWQVELLFCHVVFKYEIAELYSAIVPSGHLLLLSAVCTVWRCCCWSRELADRMTVEKVLCVCGGGGGAVVSQVVPRDHGLHDGRVGGDFIQPKLVFANQSSSPGLCTFPSCVFSLYSRSSARLSRWKS